MNDFKENHCRCCKKVFCCKKCREKHENKEHGLFPDCDICLYGRAVLTNASDNLLEHVKSMHWPLRCVFCKRFFGTTDELKNHSKCLVGFKTGDLEKSPYTPGHSYNDSVYDSPPLSLPFPKGLQPYKNANMFSNLATSTPMQRSEDNILLEHIHEALTPVDYSESDKGSVAKTKQDSDNASLKRKVTFCETPMPDSYRKQKNALKKKQIQERERTSSGPLSGNESSSVFYSLKEEREENENSITKNIHKLPPIIVEEFEEIKAEDKENTNVKHEDTTLWVSATNVSPSIDTEDHIAPCTKTPASPIATKLKKRQVNIVMPTPVPKPVQKDSSEAAENKSEISNTETDNEEKIFQFKGPDVEKPNVENPKYINNICETISETSLNVMQSRLWMSMSTLIKNVTGAIQGLSSTSENIPNTLKRRSSDYDSIDAPSTKRYKLTEIRCRRPIRELPSFEIHENFYNSYDLYRRKYVDKATQTDQ